MHRDVRSNHFLHNYTSFEDKMRKIRNNCYQPDDSEHRVEVLALSAVQGDLNEVFNGLHPLQGVGLLQDLCGDPEGLLVNHLFKLFQIATSH